MIAYAGRRYGGADKCICLELGGGQLGGGFLHRSSCGGVSGARPCRLRWRHPIGGGVDGRGGARGGDASGLSAASGLGGHAHWSRKVCVWFFGVSCIVSADRVRVVRSRDSRDPSCRIA